MRDFFAVLSRFKFRPLALGYVHDHAQNERAFRALNGADPDLDRELAPVLPPGEQFPARTHGPATGAV